MIRRVALALLLATVSAPAFAADQPAQDPAPAAQKPAKAPVDSSPVAVEAALKRSSQQQVKVLPSDSAGSDGTAVTMTTQGGEVAEASTSLASIHGSTATHADGIAGAARDVRMAAATTGTVPRPAATPRTLRRMNADRVVAALQPLLEQCYAHGLAKGSHQAGNVVLRAAVAPGGAVEATEVVAASGFSPDALACARDAVKAAKFGAPGGAGASVVVPATFAAPRGQ